MSEKRGKFRDALIARFLQKILPKWEEHGWFDEVVEKIRDMLLKRASAEVKQQQIVGETPVLPMGPEEEPFNPLDEEITKQRVTDAIKALGAMKERQKYEQVKSQEAATPVLSDFAKADVLKSIPRTPMGLGVGAPVLKTIPKTPMDMLGSLPRTPRGFQIPGTPKMPQVPGTPRIQVPGTPKMPIPGTPRIVQGSQPFTAAHVGAQPFKPEPGAQPFKPVPGLQPFTPAPGAAPDAQPLAETGIPGTPGRKRGRLPSTPTNLQDPGAAAVLPGTPRNPNVFVATQNESMTPNPGTPQGIRKRGRLPSTPTNRLPATPTNFGGMTPLLPVIETQDVRTSAPLAPSLVGQVQRQRLEEAPAPDDDGENTPVPRTLPTHSTNSVPDPTVDLGTPMLEEGVTPRAQLAGESTPLYGGVTPRVQLGGENTPVDGGVTPRAQLIGEDTPLPGEETPNPKKRRIGHASGQDSPVITDPNEPTQELPTKTRD